jgi:uncharacterized membrane protein
VVRAPSTGGRRPITIALWLTHGTDRELIAVQSFTVWRFAGPREAEDVLERLRLLALQDRIEVLDAALVSWPDCQRKPSTRVLGDLNGPGMLWGGFWGVLLGLIFLTPIAGPAFGAGAGAVAGSLADFGVQDDFVKRVRDTVTPGSSALFVICSADSVQPIAAALRDRGVAMIRSDLSYEQDQRLLDALAEESRQAG